MKLSIIVPTRNRPQLLRQMLGSLERADKPALEWEVIVVDNNSSPPEREANLQVLAACPLSPRHVLEARPGQSSALNRGIAEAGGTIVAFLDDDIVVHGGYLRGVERTVASFPAKVFGGRVLARWPAPPPRWLNKGEPLRTSRGPVVAHDYGAEPRKYAEGMVLPVGCNFFCYRELFARYGVFDPRLGPGAAPGILGGGETDLLRRMAAGGEGIVYSPWATVDHPVDPLRMSKRYFRYRFFCSGRSIPYLAPTSYPSVLGVPRYLYRKLAGDVAQGIGAAVTGRWTTLFDIELDACEVLGAMYEYRQRPRAGNGRA